jgi:hypothetical protein
MIDCRWNHWPGEDLLKKGIGFVDLCADDVDTHIRFTENGVVEGLTESARYTIEVLLVKAYVTLKAYTVAGRVAPINIRRPYLQHGPDSPRH